MSTETPRTDAAAFSATTEKPSSGDYEHYVVPASFACELECELEVFEADLALMKARVVEREERLEQAAATIDALREKISQLRLVAEYYAADGPSDGGDYARIKLDAIDAARKATP